MYHGIENIHVIRGKQRLSRTFNIFTFQSSIKFLKRFKKRYSANVWLTTYVYAFIHRFSLLVTMTYTWLICKRTIPVSLTHSNVNSSIYMCMMFR